MQTAGPALERKGDVAAFLTALEPRSVFFIDEIHRLPRAVEEIFYPGDGGPPAADHDGAGRGREGRHAAAAAVHADRRHDARRPADAPLRDRFGIQHRLDHYAPAELARIVVRSARVLGVEIDAAGARTIADALARHAARRQPPAQARARLCRGARHGGVIDAAAAGAALELLGVDATGLDRLDRELLRAICEHFGGGPVGLSTLAVTVGEEADTIEDVYEPYLLQRGFLQRTPRGRVATPHAFRHLGLGRRSAHSLFG